MSALAHDKSLDTKVPTIPIAHKSWGGRTRIGALLLSQETSKAALGTDVQVCGWVKTVRVPGKGFLFCEINDGSSVSNLQVVVNAEMPDFEKFTKVTTGAAVKFLGSVVESPAKGQTVELSVKSPETHSAELLGDVSDPATYPMAKTQINRETLREFGHLRPRSNLIGAVTRVRSALSMATHRFFQDRGFLYIHTPLITSSDCEGAGEMFQVTTLLPPAAKSINEKAHAIPTTPEGLVDYSKDFFNKPTFLTVSGQLAVENYCSALSDVYTFGPTFRAENSHTSRHLAEFWMIEPEIAFADNKSNMDCAESYLKFCTEWVLKNNKEDLDFFELRVEKGLIKRLEQIVEEPFTRISYTEAIELLQRDAVEAKFQNTNLEWGIDLATEHERWLAEKVFNKPIIVYNYPKEIKSFYMKLNEDGKTVAALDVLLPQIGEVVGGSQREDCRDVLERRIKESGLDPADYTWYLDLRRYGTMPHAGFGLGFERLVMMVTGVDSIRDVIPFPRYPGHAQC